MLCEIRDHWTKTFDPYLFNKVQGPAGALKLDKYANEDDGYVFEIMR